MSAGCVHYLTDSGKLSKLFHTETALRRLLFDERHSRLVTLTHTYLMLQHSLSADGHAQEISRVCLASCFVACVSKLKLLGERSCF